MFLRNDKLLNNEHYFRRYGFVTFNDAKIVQYLVELVRLSYFVWDGAALLSWDGASFLESWLPLFRTDPLIFLIFTSFSVHLIIFIVPIIILDTGNHGTSIRGR